MDIQDVRELEDLIIDAIYQGVIQGRLDQRKKQLEIEFTMGRDLKPEALDQMISRLDTWYFSFLFFFLSFSVNILNILGKINLKLY